jgi:crossover junction endodeoxyribonuclease RusA
MAAGWNRLTLSEGPIGLRMTFHPPDKHARDRDNMIASAKAMQDGLADALRVDDARFEIEYRFAEPRKPGAIIVEVLRPPLGSVG